MKSFKFGFLALVALSALSACGSNKNDGSNDDSNYDGHAYAMPQECRSMNAKMSGQKWQRYESLGFSSYEWGQEERQSRRGGREDRGGRSDRGGRTQGGRRYGQTGCSSGSFPACSSGVGIVCVPNQGFSNSQIALYNYTMGNTNATHMGFGTPGNGGLYAGESSGSLGMVCQPRNPVMCNGIGTCQPVASNASIGVCVR